MKMATREFSFWSIFGLVVIASTHQLSVFFFVVPVVIGLILFLRILISNKIELNSITLIYFLMAIGFFFRSLFNELLLTADFIKGFVLILSNFGLSYYFINLRISALGYRLFVIGIGVAILYFIIFLLFGVSTENSIRYVFLTSTGHMLAWIVLLGISIVEASRSQVSIFGYVLIFTLFLLLGGRTGIIVGAILLGGKYLLRRDSLNFSSYRIFLIAPILIYLGISTFDLYQNYLGDISERGLSIGPRELIYLCYFDYINVNRFIFGFDIAELESCISLIFNSLSLESSLISLNYNTGIFAVLILGILLRFTAQIYKEDKARFFCCIALLIRVTTGEFVFISAFDWLFLLVFCMPIARKNNTNNHSIN